MEHVLYVNTDYRNEATLNATMNGDIDNFGNITWQELIEDVLSTSIEVSDSNEWLQHNFGISSDQLNETIDSEAIDRYYNDLSYFQNNVTGSNVEAFHLIRSFDLFPMDSNGNGASNGIELIQSTTDGPRKYVFVEDEIAASWLIQKAAEKNVQLKVEFV